jgi:hypothetical protein
MYTADIKKLPRHFIPAEFKVTDWESLEPFFKDLLDRKIQTKDELEKWLRDAIQRISRWKMHSTSIAWRFNPRSSLMLMH